MSAYSSFLERVAMPLVGRALGMPVARYLRELEASQWWSPEELRALQWRKFKRLLDHAYRRVPYYRRRMEEAGVAPDDIRSWEDVPRVPISTKEDLRAAFPHGTVAAGVNRRDLLMSASSGSTGEPFRYYLTRDEKARRWAIIFRYWAWAGLRPGVPYANLTRSVPGAFHGSGWLARLEQRLIRVLELPALDFSEENAGEYLARVRRFRPEVMRGYASSMYYLATYLREGGEVLPLRAVLTLGETLYPYQREAIEDAFACPVYDAYGAEAMEVAAQCGHHPGYHINAESILVEVVDAEGNPLPPGERGQLVLTNLENYAMPFIRYNIQDVGVLSEERCPCGRGLPLLGAVEGRLSDLIVTSAGKVLASPFFGMLMMDAEVEQYQFVQERPDRIVLRVVPSARYSAEEEARILKEVRRYVGSGVDVVVERVQEIPRTRGGKRRWFISCLLAEEVARALGSGTSPHPQG
ncbi:MAG: phenylacetate--CoA ligase family protein [Anaerolineae bacterium]